ncbi:MAG: hypothetical protein IKV66_10925 [Clostridia bacterium]|nr:hypothetical protein [Clostridia bacterium]
MSANKLNLGQFIHWDWGQNYPFGACMAKLMECLCGDTSLYTYDFFAGLAGDDFVMCYGDNEKFNDCVSVCTDNAAFLSRVCGMIGLEYRLIRRDKWKSDTNVYYNEARRYIDRGIPVLCAGVGKNGNYDLLISYDDETAKCYLSCGDDVQYGTEIPFSEIECDLIFIEHLPQITDLAAVYRTAVMQIPTLMTAKPTADGVCFGASAYRQWADDIIGGRYDRYSAETFDGWAHWCIYICNLATNASHGDAFLRRALDLNPDMTFISELIALLHENDAAWKALESLGGGFNCTIETLHDGEKAAAITDVIRKLADINEKIVRLVSANEH